MPSTLTLSEDGTLIVVHVIGKLTFSIVRQLMTDTIAMTQTTGAHNVLIDACENKVRATTMEAYDLGTLLAKHKHLGLRFALVVHEDLPVHPFFETVVLNRGMSVRYFKEYEQALAWLQPRDEPPTPYG
jgi:hypothetical protein